MAWGCGSNEGSKHCRHRRKTWSIIFLSQVIVLIAAQGKVCGAGFIIQPDPADGIAAIGQQAKFRCRASDGFKFSKWEVTIPEVRELSTSNNNHVNALRHFGVTFTSESERDSCLIFNATVMTSGTVVTCEVENISNFLLASKSSEVTTFFYGPPLPPSQVLVADLSNGSLWVSWNVSSTAPVNPTFSLTILRNNSFTGEESTYTMSNLMAQNTVLAYNSSFCDTFYIWVTAENAGRSSSSEVAVWVPPYQHDYPSVSLRHSLSRDITGIRLTVDLEVPSVCPEYMAIVFDVVLTNVSGAVRMWRQSGLQPRQESLPAGQVFSLQVMSKGSSVSAQEIFVTSDVQDVDVCIRSEGLVIRCIFLSGSRTSGCGYKLVSIKEGMPDIFGYVAKAYTEGLDEQISDIASYSEILIYDALGRDDRSNVGIAINRSLQNLSSCPVTMMTGTRHNGGKCLAAYKILLLFSLFLALCFILFTLSVITY